MLWFTPYIIKMQILFFKKNKEFHIYYVYPEEIWANNGKEFNKTFLNERNIKMIHRKTYNPEKLYLWYFLN